MPGYDDRLTRLVLTLFRANGAMLAWGDLFAAPSGLTSARWQMLGALALSAEPLSSPRIAEFMGVSRQGAQKQLNLLLADGLVEHLPNQANARSPLYRLTPSGSAKYAAIESAWKRHARSLSRHLPATEIDDAADLLERMAMLHTAPAPGSVS